MKYIFILGSNPELSKAELQAYFALPSITILNDNIALINLDEELRHPQADLDKLGGTIKIAKLIAEKVDTLHNSLKKVILENLADYRHIGLSFHEINQKTRPTIFKLKKELKQEGKSVRFIIPKDKILNAATIRHNKLLQKGTELLVIKDIDQLIFGQTVAVQNVDKYSKRDYGKPKPDATSGMLPPKLAQIMINLTLPHQPNNTIYDPFCGSGAVLQEALLQGINVIASDNSPKAIYHTKENLKWLIKQFDLDIPNYRKFIEKNVFQADATYYKLEKPVDQIVTEPYLGPPARVTPTPERAQSIIDRLLPLYQEFLKNSLNNLNPGGKLIMVLPILTTTATDQYIPLKSLLDDNLVNQYNLLSKDLVYKQPKQRIYRQLLLLAKK